MRKFAVFMNSLVAPSLLVMAFCGHAVAQAAVAPSESVPPSPAGSAAPAASAATAAPSSAATETPPSAPAATDTPAPTAAAPATPPAEAPPASYFRIDHDYQYGLQLWAGATHALGEGIGLATDIYIAEVEGGVYKGATYSWYGEFDIGPAFTFGPLSVTPMVGIGFDWGAKHANLINGPQLYTILNTDKIYVESWIWTLLYSPFKEAPSPDIFHTRDWILYKLSGTIAVGPQLELWYNLKSKTINDTPYKSGLTSMPFGGHVDIGYGTGNTLGIFLGYETNKDGREARGGNAAVGRFTFVHNF
jgi:hypothetical protein